MEVTDFFNFHTDKSTAVLTSVTTTTVDLSFLTDRERAIILKVIKADLELKRSTLGCVVATEFQKYCDRYYPYSIFYAHFLTH